jgi:ferredoxin--NADP+ reductase
VVPPPDGNLTPLLHELSIGAEMTLRPRGKGIFVIQPQFKNHIFVGTVTGVVPYVSMLRKFLTDTNWPDPEKMENLKREDYQFHVLEGASYVDEFGYDEELTKLSNEHDFIHFYPSVSRPDEAKNSDWNGAKGRINNLVEDYISKLGIDPKETCVYACGHPQMIEDVEKRFSGTEFTFLEERFWKDDE